MHVVVLMIPKTELSSKEGSYNVLDATLPPFGPPKYSLFCPRLRRLGFPLLRM